MKCKQTNEANSRKPYDPNKPGPKAQMGREPWKIHVDGKPLTKASSVDGRRRRIRGARDSSFLYCARLSPYPTQELRR